MSAFAAIITRAQGCLLGQLIGDSLGSLVEFSSPPEIRRQFPDGVRELTDGGVWGTIAGQPTDDSEMALALARSLIRCRGFDRSDIFNSYSEWINSDPFDCGATVRLGLSGQPYADSQANGALMRISPLGIFGASQDLNDVAVWARQDAELTHPHPVCVGANMLFAALIADAIRWGDSPMALYERTAARAVSWQLPDTLLTVLTESRHSKPADYVNQQGWVLTAFQNAMWQLLHTNDFETAVVETVMQGGDTDTNAAICGALLGAVHSLDAIPDRWISTVLNCRPVYDNSSVHRPRPEAYWPVDALRLAVQLIEVGSVRTGDNV